MAADDAYVAGLERRIVELEAENAELRALVVAQAELIARLEKRVSELERDASRYSGNSSKPPSGDTADQRAVQNTRRQAKRTKTGRRQGKQPGAPGANLARVTDPDHVERHKPPVCEACGDDLGDAPTTGIESRQVFDVPARRAEITDHQAEKRRCRCGHETAAAFPAEATAPACWGPRTRAMAVCLLVRHHIPVARVAEILTDLLGAPVSVGWVAGLCGEAADGLEDFIVELCDRLAGAPVVHVDETGARVEAAKWWFHVAATAMITFIGVHRRRGVAATDEFGILPRFAGTMVHDRWAPYWRYTDATHAICAAHLLRDLEAVAEDDYQRPWAEAMAFLLCDAIRRCERARGQDRSRLPAGQRRMLRGHYNTLVVLAIAANRPPPDGRARTASEKASFNLAVAFRDHRDEILRFIDDLAVSADNNQAERDLRMVKLQQKISGSFRTENGAVRFARVRSYVETVRKHGLNPLDALIQLFNGDPWTIPSAAGT